MARKCKPPDEALADLVNYVNTMAPEVGAQYELPAGMSLSDFNADGKPWIQVFIERYMRLLNAVATLEDWAKNGGGAGYTPVLPPPAGGDPVDPPRPPPFPPE